MKKNNKSFYIEPQNFFQDIDEHGISISIPSYFAKVVSYPDEEISGAIQFRLLHHDKNSILKETELLIAYPLNPQHYTKPVPNQIIKIAEVQGYYFYQGLYQSSTNENGDFAYDLFNEEDLGTTNKPDTSDYKGLMNGTKEPTQQGQYDLKGFEQKDIPNIQEKAGDTLLKGLQNNDIILSYDENNNPTINLIINRDTNQYNPNTEGFQIYGEYDIDSKLEIPCDKKNNFPSDESNGSGGILNLDKVRINANLGSIFLGANQNISLSSNGSTTIDNKQETKIDSPEIFLGKDAQEPLVKGDSLKSILEELIDAINQITVATTQGTSSVPLNKVKFITIKRKLNRILSKQNRTL